MAKRHWSVEMPKKYENVKDPTVKWQAERLTFKQGLEEVPKLAFFIYETILLALLVITIIAIRVLPSTITVGQLFDLYTKQFPTVLFLGMVYVVEVYLIYRDIIRRSMSRYLCVIPGMYFFLAIYIIMNL